jgi:hypothetical protein
MATIFIRSAAFPNIHLRMDRTAVTGFSDGGSGIVNCQLYEDAGTEPSAGSYEAFNLIVVPAFSQPSGVAFAFESTVTGAGPAFLRMDPGSENVNCQFYSQGEPEAVAGNDEVFQIVPIPGSPLFAIQSFNSPNAYLSMDGSSMQGWNGAGGGIVTVGFSDGIPAAESSEAFFISAVLNAGANTA